MYIKRVEKTGMLSIVADEVTRLEVWNFAEIHRMRNSEIHESFDGEVYLIDFYVSKPVEAITDYLKQKFEDKFNVKIKQNYIYVTEKTES